MRTRQLVKRSLTFYRRTHLATVLGAAVGTAVLAGALIVGDAMRESLRERALGQIGLANTAAVGARFFSEALADKVQAELEPGAHVVPAIIARGGVVHDATRARVQQVQILGIDQRFAAIVPDNESLPLEKFTGNNVAINQALATDLGAAVGDTILLRLGKPQSVATETLLGRRDQTAATLRATVVAILPGIGIADFSLAPRQVQARNVFLNLKSLQRRLDQRERVSALIVDQPAPQHEAEAEYRTRYLTEALNQHLTLADVGLTLRIDEQRKYASVESDRFLLPLNLEQAVREAADNAGLEVEPLLAYLANRIAPAQEATAKAIPYSTVVAIPEDGPTLAELRDRNGKPVILAPGQTLLNGWSERQLAPGPDASIQLSYYISTPGGELVTRTHDFAFAGTVAMTPAATDSGFTPEYPGISDTEDLADWNPPFPVDLKLIQDRDETYWDDYRTAPKAFITLNQGRNLWLDPDARHGRSTALRIRPIQKIDAFRAALDKRLDSAAAGITIQDVRARAEQAARGSTDFGGLFIGFSFFLIAAAAMLVSLLFRLAVERRATEIGLLLATGFTVKRVRRLLFVEGGILAVVGVAIGLPLAAGYAWLMLAGLRGWWSAAANAPFLQLHVSAVSLVIGALASLFLAAFAIRTAVTQIIKRAPAALLKGSTESPLAGQSRTNRRAMIILLAALTGAITVGAVGFVADRPAARAGAFFGSGALMLLAGIAALAWRLRAMPRRTVGAQPGRRIWSLAARQTRRHAGRSLLAAGLLASAGFLVLAIEAFRQEADTTTGGIASGTGGYDLVVEAAVPLPYDLATASGRESLVLDDEINARLGNAAVIPLRYQPGDEASCLNLYVPGQPTVLGATEAFINRGGFTFAASERSGEFAGNHGEADGKRHAGNPGDAGDRSHIRDRNAAADSRHNRNPGMPGHPWRLLHADLDANAIPVIGDKAAVRWQMHKNLGDQINIADENGNQVPLQFVALLKGSVLQGQLIVSERNFTRLFPSVNGYGFYLIDAAPTKRTHRSEPSENTNQTGMTTESNPSAPSATTTTRAEAFSPDEFSAALETQLEAFSVDVIRADQRLAEYYAVQNTYLATFQTLGGLGLVLGSLGLIVVMLRNVWERRGELALLRALGWTRPRLAWLVIAENAFLVTVGLAIGLVAAAVAVSPQLVASGQGLPIGSLLLIVLGVGVGGIGTAALALPGVLDAPLQTALRDQ